MTFSIYDASEIVSRLKSYIQDERPMNLREMRDVLDILEPLVRSGKIVVNAVPAEKIPSFCRNEYRTLKEKLGRF